jgi:hypothetical protein
MIEARAAGRQRFGGDQRDLGLGIGVGQALGGFVGKGFDRLQEPVTHFLRSKQLKCPLQRRAVFRPDGADQQFPATGGFEVFMPRGHAVAGRHDYVSSKVR